MIIKTYLVRSKFCPEFCVFFWWQKYFAVLYMKSNLILHLFHWALKNYFWQSWKNNTVLFAVFNLKRNCFILLTINQCLTTTKNLKISQPTKKKFYLEVPPLGIVVHIILPFRWEAERNMHLFPPALSLGIAASMCAFLGCMERTKDQAHRSQRPCDS